MRRRSVFYKRLSDPGGRGGAYGKRWGVISSLFKMKRRRAKISLLGFIFLIGVSCIVYLLLTKSVAYKYGDKPRDFEGENLYGKRVIFRNEPGKVKLLVFFNQLE